MNDRSLGYVSALEEDDPAWADLAERLARLGLRFNRPKHAEGLPPSLARQ